MSAPVPFGPYELHRRLGSGGMAETFLAIRRGPGGFEQRVCVKRILPAWEGDPDFVRQFMDEARLAAQLRHANIVQVVDFGVVDGRHYLAIELVDGVDLRSLCRALRERGELFSPRIAVHLAIELASALEVAHTAQDDRPPVIHRDISPSNILLSRAGEVYLIDFGVARALGVKRHTASGVVRGKIPYIAAEYAMTGSFDARSDLFALGVVLYEVLAGRRPFDGATDLDTLTRIKDGHHEPLAQLCPAPATLVSIVEQLLRPDPNERFQSAAALLEALSTIATPPTVARELAELVRAQGEPLSKSFDVALPSQTVSMPGVTPPPSYPGITPSTPDAVTRTAEAGPPKERWSSTDPTHVSHHDQPSPFSVRQALPAVEIPMSIPTTATRLPVPSTITSQAAPPPARVPWLWLALGGFAAFATTGIVAYFVVILLRGS